MTKLPTTPKTPATDKKMSSYRWIICAMLFFATTVNYLDRQVLSLTWKDFIAPDFHWTNWHYGLITSCFSGLYALAMLFAGRFVDRLDTKRGYLWSIGIWSVGACIHALCGLGTEVWVGLAGGPGAGGGEAVLQSAKLTSTIVMASVTMFVFARLVLAVGEAGNFPAAIKATAEYFPKKARGFATSIFNAGAQIGALIAPVSIPVIAKYWGWEASFIIIGALGFVWMGFWLFIYKKPEANPRVNGAELAYILQDDAGEDDAARQSGGTEWEQVVKVAANEGDGVWQAAEGLNDGWRSAEGLAAGRNGGRQVVEGLAGTGSAAEKKISFGRCFRQRQTWAFAAGKFMTDGVWWFYLYWAPAYLSSVYDMPSSDPKAQIAIFVLYAVSMLSLVGGWLPTYFISRRGMNPYQGRMRAMLIFAFFPLLALLAQPLGHISYWVPVIIIGIAGAAHQAWSANIFSTIGDMFPKSSIATITGIGGMAGGLGSMVINFGSGALFDHAEKTGMHLLGFEGIESGYMIIFSVCAVAYLVGWVIMKSLVPRYKLVEVQV